LLLPLLSALCCLLSSYRPLLAALSSPLPRSDAHA
jgi:hypothetical protein